MTCERHGGNAGSIMCRECDLETIEREGGSMTTPTPTPRTDDMALLIARLARSLRKQDPGNTLAQQAVRYLQSNSLLSPLRDGDEPDEDIQSLLAQNEGLVVTNIQLERDLAAAQSALAAKDAEWDALKSHADALAKEVHHLNWAPESALNAYLYAYPKKDAP